MAAVATLILVAACTGKSPTQKASPFAGWLAGDVHVHAAGDADLIKHPRCKSGPGDWLGDRACARQTVKVIGEAASAAGLDWIVLSEHGNWLGGVLRYVPTEGARQWGLLREEASVWSRTALPRFLIGQEQASYQLGGHFSTFYQKDLLHQPVSDTDEVNYMARAALGGAWGAVNHPDDPRNPWRCWNNFEGSDAVRKFCNAKASASAHPPLADAYAQRWTPQGIIDPAAGVTWRAIEIASRGNAPGAKTLATWDALLRRGFVLWAVGGSDAHTISRSHLIARPTEARIGQSRTYAFAPAVVGRSTRADGSIPGARAKADFDSGDRHDPVRGAIFEGRTIASTGLLAVPSIGSALPGSTVDATSATTFGLRIQIDTARAADATPGEITVVVGAIEGGCGTHCSPGTVTRGITAAEWSSGVVEISIDMPADVRRQYVRIEATANLSDRGDGKPGVIGAWSSPIFLQRA